MFVTDRGLTASGEAALAGSWHRPQPSLHENHREPMDEYLCCGCEPVTWPLLPTKAAATAMKPGPASRGRSQKY